MGEVKAIFWQCFVLLLCTGSFASVLLGAGLLLKPGLVVSLSKLLSHWVTPAEKVAEELDRPRWIERFFYRHHRLVGSALFIGALIILYVFLFSPNSRKIFGVIPPDFLPLLDAATALLLVGSVLAALVGVIVAIRPSLLREIEKASNRWIATEQIANAANQMHHSFDDWLLRYRKAAGTVLVLGGIFVLVNLAPHLWGEMLKF